MSHIGKFGFPRRIAAVLVDCDGVLVDSIDLSDQALRVWAKRVGLEPDLVVSTARGRRVPEIISRLLPAERVEEELAFFTQLEIGMASEVEACPGARELLSVLHRGSKWAIVTSASEAVTKARLAAAGLPLPPVLVTADDVTKGKPEPECYLIAANRLAVLPERCLALDDLAIGIESARRAGATTILVGEETHIMASVSSLKQIHLVVSGEEFDVDLIYSEASVGSRQNDPDS